MFNILLDITFFFKNLMTTQEFFIFFYLLYITIKKIDIFLLQYGNPNFIVNILYHDFS